MSGATTECSRWDALERWCPTLFLAGGVLWIVAAGINSMIHFAGILNTEVLSQVFVSGGFLFAYTGLLGFYPELSDWKPRLAKWGLGIAGLTVIGAAANVIWSVLSVLLPGVNVLEAESPAIAIVVVSGLLFLITPLLFGVIVLRANAFSRSVGGSSSLREPSWRSSCSAPPTRSLEASSSSERRRSTPSSSCRSGTRCELV